ncbi:uncharacterized protein LOC131614319 [Vicia villosa]|uniref:uncharacterized protein LOC131614319 n=1 Tax=Vicia villosa TaxID=3911 RepID=UPI00273B11AE|nr:uncharacterized protein LOC131614319 [Vicia villosa]
MRSKYQGSMKVNRAQLQALHREFEVICTKDSETIDEYFASTLVAANKMTAQGEKLAQTTIVKKVLRYMTINFNYVVCSIEESNDVTTLSIDELKISPLVHEQIMKINQEKEEEQALKIENYGGGSNNNKAKGRGGYRGRGREDSVEIRFNVTNVTRYDTTKVNF